MPDLAVFVWNDLRQKLGTGIRDQHTHSSWRNHALPVSRTRMRSWFLGIHMYVHVHVFRYMFTCHFKCKHSNVIFTCMYVQVHVYSHVCSTCMYFHLFVCSYVWFVCVFACMSHAHRYVSYVCSWLYVCMYVPVCVHVFSCIYIPMCIPIYGQYVSSYVFLCAHSFEYPCVCFTGCMAHT